MSKQLCRLCEKQPAITGSHVIPKLVFKAIKSDSASGFLRLPSDPNRRMQDGDKQPLLCQECEGRFNVNETLFSNKLFQDFHKHDHDHFQYGDWLHYFISSLSWRTLVLDLAHQETRALMSEPVLNSFMESASDMRAYLLGGTEYASRIENHVFLFTAAHVCNDELAQSHPNFLLRRSAGGYSVWDGAGYAAIFHNLAGVLCFTHIKKNPRDEWTNTKLHPEGGALVQPQRMYSWLGNEIGELVINMNKSREAMTDRQKAVVEKAVLKNPSAHSLRFHELDEHLETDPEQFS